MNEIMIFYSWQSDLKKTNMGIIQDAIKRAVKNIQQQGNVKIRPRVTRDTQGVSGAPNISQAIFDKISKCGIFIADISIVNNCGMDGIRYTPNPNVLVELGYAIASIGWERIILVYNLFYGKHEDLPFDIQQHKRIEYTLGPGEDKAVVKRELVGDFAAALLGIISSGVIEIDIPNPLKISWAYFEYKRTDRPPSEIKVSIKNELKLHRADSIEEITNKVNAVMDEVDSLDGSIDPEWDRKKQKFLEKCVDFKEKFNSDNNEQKIVFANNYRCAKKVTLVVENIGSKPASDVRIKLELPGWIMINDESPLRDNNWAIPKKPNPVRSAFQLPGYFSNNAYRDFGMIGMNGEMFSGVADRLLRSNFTKRCFFDGNLITFRADKILHKHKVYVEDDSFYLLALPDAPIGEHIIPVKVFCSEFKDWVEDNILILIS